jgi:hypothetical protein
LNNFQDWKPTWGYKRANDLSKLPYLEIPDNAGKSIAFIYFQAFASHFDPQIPTKISFRSSRPTRSRELPKMRPRDFAISPQPKLLVFFFVALR